jgi:hypothetical protein
MTIFATLALKIVTYFSVEQSAIINQQWSVKKYQDLADVVVLGLQRNLLNAVQMETSANLDVVHYVHPEQPLNLTSKLQNQMPR